MDTSSPMGPKMATKAQGQDPGPGPWPGPWLMGPSQDPRPIGQNPASIFGPMGLAQGPAHGPGPWAHGRIHYF